MLFVFLILFLLSQSFDDALNLYKEGKREEALKLLERIYKESPNKEVKSLLVKILTEIGMEKSFKEDYSGALIYFERAKEIAPDDELVLDLYNTTKEILKASPPPEEKKKEKKVERVKERVVIEKTKPVIRAYEMKRLLEAFLKLEERQTEFLKEFVKERKEIDAIFKEEKKRENFYSNIIYINVIAIVLSVIFVGIIMYLVFRNIALRKEAVLLRYQERLIESMSEKTLPEAEKIPLTSPEETKLKGIEVIEGELKEDKGVEKEMAIKFLKNFISDPSYEVKEKAIRVLSKYDRDEAVKVLKDLWDKGTRDDRILFLKMSDIMPEEEVLSYLSQIIDYDPELRGEAIKIIEERFSEDELSDDIKEKIKRIKKEEGWITR
ncbi:MAG: hypothetical protein DRI36_04470 [Caldiserica bacterium]|mgnify:CR=1 FL=1|nr:MAG: hypothetical protein DRI36_04470 [Caldisericota bacterium]